MKLKTTGTTVATPQGQTPEIYRVAELAVDAAAILSTSLKVWDPWPFMCL